MAAEGPWTLQQDELLWLRLAFCLPAGNSLFRRQVLCVFLVRVGEAGQEMLRVVSVGKHCFVKHWCDVLRGTQEWLLQELGRGMRI